MEWFYGQLRKVKRSTRFPKLRALINSMFYDPTTVILHWQNLDTVSVDGCQFYASDQIDLIQRVENNPWFAGVRKEDIVLDLGAHIGAITIPLAKKAKRVFAVEPLFYRELERNVALNNLNNVSIVALGMGNGQAPKHLSFSSKEGQTLLRPFSWFKDWVGGHIDFLKVDIEGYEWEIPREELVGIREMRFEFHIRRRCKAHDMTKLDGWLRWLEKEGYSYTIEYGLQPAPMVEFCECILLLTSKQGGNDDAKISI